MCDTTGISAYTPYITAIGGVIAGGISSYLVGVKLSQRSHDKAIALLKRQGKQMGSETDGVIHDK